MVQVRLSDQERVARPDRAQEAADRVRIESSVSVQIVDVVRRDHDGIQTPGPPMGCERLDRGHELAVGDDHEIRRFTRRPPERAIPPRLDPIRRPGASRPPGDVARVRRPTREANGVPAIGRTLHGGAVDLDRPIRIRGVDHRDGRRAEAVDADVRRWPSHGSGAAPERVEGDALGRGMERRRVLDLDPVHEHGVDARAHAHRAQDRRRRAGTQGVGRYPPREHRALASVEPSLRHRVRAE